MEATSVDDGTSEVGQSFAVKYQAVPYYVVVIDEDQRLALEQACVCAIVVNNQIAQELALPDNEDLKKFYDLRTKLIDLKKHAYVEKN
jgi:hypothetical protein